MTIWFDVTDLHYWQIGHLTGIPRTGVGIHNGLVELGLEVRLFRYSASDGEVLIVTPADLPETVCRALGGTPRVHIAPEERESTSPPRESPAAPETPRADRLHGLRQRGLRALERHPGGQDLLQALRECVRSARHLLRAFAHLTRRAGKTEAPPVIPPPATSPVASPVALLPITKGDLVFAMISTGLPEHIVDSLRAKGARVVRLIYDMIPVLKPQWVKPRDTERFKRWVEAVLQHSDLLLAISHFTASEVIRYCGEQGLTAPTIAPIRLADVLEGATAGGAAGRPAFVPGRAFFLCVCTLDIRKNHRLLYDTWARLQAEYGNQCPDLLLIGTEHYFMADFIREFTHDPLLCGHIHWLKSVGDQDLDWYYRNCLATLYPSKYEGWGLPVAESLGYGKICLSSNASSMPEISDLPLFFSPWSGEELAALVRKVWQDEAWRREYESRIRASFTPTTWADTASSIMGTLSHLDSTTPTGQPWQVPDIAREPR